MIKLVIFDFDGVFTDGKFYFDNNDNIKKCYNGKDAYSLKIIKKYDIKCGVITNDKVISIKHAPHIFDRLEEWCTDIVYFNHNKQIESFPYKHDKPIYNLLLDKMINEESNEDEHCIPSYTKNAGGFTHGVLIEYT